MFVTIIVRFDGLALPDTDVMRLANVSETTLSLQATAMLKMNFANIQF